jgi:hypothetical protein
MRLGIGSAESQRQTGVGLSHAMGSYRLQIDHAYTISIHVQDVELPIKQSQG